MKRKLSIVKDLANQRMTRLYSLAVSETRKGRFDLARRYISILIAISRKAQVRPYKYIRRGYCRRCKIPLIPSLTSRVRVRSERKYSRIVVTCLLCGWRRRFVVKPRN